MSASSVHECVARLRDAHPCVQGRGWDFDGFRVWVDSNDVGLLEQLGEYFADFRSLPETSREAAARSGPLTRITAIECATPPLLAEPSALTIGEHVPSVRGPKEGYVDLADGRIVVKLRTGMQFAFGVDDHLAIGPCRANANQVINFVNNRMIQWALHRGALLGHASAVARRVEGEALPRTIAIAGFAGMGKSTLSLRLMNDRRLDFLSNDRVMLHGDGTIEGVPKHPRINPGTILANPDLVGVLDEHERARFSALARDELWQLEHKFDGVIRTCFPSQRFWLRGRFVGLVLLDWTRSGSDTQARRIDLRERVELLDALIKAPGVFYRPGPGERARSKASYLELLADVPVVELAGRVDFERGYVAALELLELAPSEGTPA